MSGVWKARLTALPFFMRELWNSGLALVRREPDRRDAALQFVRDEASKGDPVSVLRTLDRFAKERRFLMNVRDEKGPMLEEHVRAAGAGARILELGSFVGYSAILMGRHLSTAGSLTSIDIDAHASSISSQMAEFAGIGERAHFLTGNSKEVIAELTEPFDIVFLDHHKPFYRQDMEKILERELLRPNALVIADNVGPLFGENEYVPWMKAREDFESEYITSHVEYSDIEDGVLISRWIG